MKKAKPIRRFVPDEKQLSISLLNQAKRAMLEQIPLPPHVANYLLEAIRSITIHGEKNAQRAFGLTERRGAPDKTIRDTLFAWRVDELRAKINRDQAFEEAMREFPHITSEGAADSAYRNGKEELDWLREKDEFTGANRIGSEIERLKREHGDQKVR